MRPPAPPHALAAPHALPPARRSRQVPPRAAPPAALLTSLTVRAGWVAPVTGMGQWGSGLRPDPIPGGRICRFRLQIM